MALHLVSYTKQDKFGNEKYFFEMEENHVELEREEVGRGCNFEVEADDDFIEFWSSLVGSLIDFRIEDDEYATYLEMTEEDVEGKFVSKQTCGFYEDESSGSPFTFHTKGAAGILKFRLFVKLPRGASVDIPAVRFYSTIHRDN